MKVSDQIRRIIDASGMTRYRIGKLLEVDNALMSRFMNRKAGLSMEVLDKLGELLKIKLSAGAKASKAKANKRKAGEK